MRLRYFLDTYLSRIDTGLTDIFYHNQLLGLLFSSLAM